MKDKTIYLPKPIQSFPTKWTIATTAGEFKHVLSVNVDEGYHDEWPLKDHHYGVTCYYDRFIVVCLPLDVELHTLVHEAVHVKQIMMDDAGERDPGREVEAYTVDFIFRTLLAEIERRRQCVTAVVV